MDGITDYIEKAQACVDRINKVDIADADPEDIRFLKELCDNPDVSDIKDGGVQDTDINLQDLTSACQKIKDYKNQVKKPT